jgi:CheY-like chemotaxis protein
VLVAEDNAVNRNVLLRMLQKLGCEADAVGTGREAVEAVARARYDLVLMDVQMPEMDGFEATRQIRLAEEPRGTHVPIFAITAHVMNEDRARCLASGMDAFITKPVKLADLAEAVGGVRPADGEADGAQPAGTLDVAQLEASTGGDPGFTRDIVSLFLRQSAEAIGALESSIVKGSSPQVEQGAHSLKGSCQSLGAKPLAAVFSRLERVGRQGDLDTARDLLAEARREFERLRRDLDRHLAAAAGRE